MKKVLLFLLSATCAFAAPIKIGVLGPFSGASAWWGQPYKDSVLLAYEELGLTPEKVQLIFEDWGEKYPQLALATQKLVHVDKVDAVINTFDKCGYISAPILKQAKIPQLVLALDDRVADGKTTFSVWSPIQYTTEMLLKEAVHTGHKELALFVLRDYYPLRAEIEIKKQLKNYSGLKIVHTEYFNPEERDFRMISLKARQSQWDLGVVLAYPPTATLVTRQLLADGKKELTSIEAFDMLGDDTSMLPDGTWWTGGAEHRSEFNAAFEKRFGYKPFTGPCYGYDSLKLLVKAFEMNRQHPAEALKGLSVLGAGGTTTMTAEGWTQMPAYLKKWQSGKKIILRAL